MAIKATVGSGAQRELIPEDNHVARCYRMIHIGTYEDEYMGEPRIVNKVRLTFELPNELRIFNEEKGEQPMAIDLELTLSLGDKSNMKKLLESWRGKAFTEEEKAGFDITKLVSAPCMLNIIHRTAKSGNVYAKITGISKVPKGFKVPEQINPSFIFDYENNFDEAFVNSLPDFIKNPIQSSNEWKHKMNLLEGAEHEKHMASIAVEAEDEDDLPF